MGFVFDGISSSDMKIKARLTSWKVLPDITNNTQSISGKAGVADYGCTSKEKIITVSCNIYPQKNFADLVAILDDVAEWLDPENGTKTLIFDEIPDRYFNARIRGQVNCERILRSAGSFELTFICPDPHAYAVEDENFVLAEEGAMTITRQIGNKESYPVYCLRGYIPIDVDSKISISINNISLDIRGLLSEEETLVIDTALMTAKVIDNTGITLRNGLKNMVDMNFPVLKKGENAVSIFTEGEAAFSQLSIQAKSRWR